VDFNDQHRGRLTVIRNLLDRLPDFHVRAPDVALTPLKRKPEKEKFGDLKPISPYRGD
jgi:hypothetical protein